MESPAIGFGGIGRRAGLADQTLEGPQCTAQPGDRGLQRGAGIRARPCAGLPEPAEEHYRDDRCVGVAVAGDLARQPLQEGCPHRWIVKVVAVPVDAAGSDDQPARGVVDREAGIGVAGLFGTVIEAGFQMPSDNRGLGP